MEPVPTWFLLPPTSNWALGQTSTESLTETCLKKKFFTSWTLPCTDSCSLDPRTRTSQAGLACSLIKSQRSHVKVTATERKMTMKRGNKKKIVMMKSLRIAQVTKWGNSIRNSMMMSKKMKANLKKMMSETKKMTSQTTIWRHVHRSKAILWKPRITTSKTKRVGTNEVQIKTFEL